MRIKVIDRSGRPSFFWDKLVPWAVLIGVIWLLCYFAAKAIQQIMININLGRIRVLPSPKVVNLVILGEEKMPGIVKVFLATAAVLFAILLASLVVPVIGFFVGLPFEAKLWLLFFVLVGVFAFGVLKMAPALDEEGG